MSHVSRSQGVEHTLMSMFQSQTKLNSKMIYVLFGVVYQVYKCVFQIQVDKHPDSHASNGSIHVFKSTSTLIHGRPMGSYMYSSRRAP